MTNVKLNLFVTTEYKLLIMFASLLHTLRGVKDSAPIKISQLILSVVCTFHAELQVNNKTKQVGTKTCFPRLPTEVEAVHHFTIFTPILFFQMVTSGCISVTLHAIYDLATLNSECRICRSVPGHAV